MELGEQINRQRVKYVVSSYQLAGEAGSAFDADLEELLDRYPAPLIELAIVQTLANNWVTVPLPRGGEFLTLVHRQLKSWEHYSITTSLTPELFSQITGLDPGPVFGSSGSSSAQPTAPSY